MYVIIVTNNEGRFFYSATRGLVKERWRATKFDSWEGAEVACRLIGRSKQRMNWFVQRKQTSQVPAEFPV